MSGIVRPYRGIQPRLAGGVYLAPTAAVVGDVEIGEDSSVWYGAVLRGDVGKITLGQRTNVQDLACIHLSLGLSNTTIADDVTIGHHATIHGATVGAGALIGIGSIILDNAVIGSEAWVSAGGARAGGDGGAAARARARSAGAARARPHRRRMAARPEARRTLRRCRP